MKEKVKHGFFPEGQSSLTDFPGSTLSDIRNKQSGTRYNNARPLEAEEIDVLEKNGCSCEEWALLRVKEPFDPLLIKRVVFEGVVRIGILENGFLKDKELSYPCGITNSRIVSSDIGDYCAIHNNSLVSTVITGNYVIFTDNNEIYTTENAKFGNCILKDGEDISSLRKVNLVNERGGRSVALFSGITASDILLWIKYRGEGNFTERLTEFTLKSFDSSKGYYSFFDDYTIIKGTALVRNTMTGRGCSIKRASCVDEVTVNSTAIKPAVILDNSVVRRGTIGEGCRIESSSIAEDFMMAPGSTLKLGARFIHSYLGSSSNVSCCEVQSSFIFSCHEQHHNNSFLIASAVMGQSNVAAGATLGSNHNGRMNDCEMWAGRGFWPGLSSSVRFNSRFASFCLLAKSDFPYELDIKFPFSLVSNNAGENCLDIIPAYWWLYNMYALFRNYFKYKDRISGIKEMEGVELDFMAPDTAEEVLSAVSLIKERRRKAVAIETASKSINLELPPDEIEGSGRVVKLMRVDKAERAYRQMLIFYSGYVISQFIKSASGNLDLLLKAVFTPEREKNWVNAGGHLLPEKTVKSIVKAVNDKSLNSWEEVHDKLEKEFELYESRKLTHAVSVAMHLYDEVHFDIALLEKLKSDYIDILAMIEKEIRLTREKDFEDNIRKNLFSDQKEMDSVLGTLETDPVIKQFRRFFAENLPGLT
ncbi:MAG: DUF4954 family protein [Spirochaetia bacterium]|jgi:carbonic anhydrase/acetyltransferase-like protein (isoleucine patch superfamily)|nr:DUF4954 family protein [Spirochaetia bacterium]